MKVSTLGMSNWTKQFTWFCEMRAVRVEFDDQVALHQILCATKSQTMDNTKSDTVNYGQSSQRVFRKRPTFLLFFCGTSTLDCVDELCYFEMVFTPIKTKNTDTKKRAELLAAKLFEVGVIGLK